MAAQNAAAERASGEIVAFSDANCLWAPDALRRLVEPFADPAVGYVCGQVRFTDADGGNLEGAYWRYEMAVREMESALAGVTAGNGGIYAVRREAYIPLPPSGSHDLSFPFALAKRGLRSLYAPWARAEEKMVPTLEGEFARKRRMMVGLWDIVVGEGMLSPRGYSPLYAFELASHRLLRYLTPVPAPDRLRRQPRAARPGLGLRRDPRRPARLRRRRPARPGPAAGAAALRPLLRDDDRLDRRRPLGPRPPRRPGHLGEGGGDPVNGMPRAFDIVIAVLALVVLSPLLLIAAIAIKLGSRGPVVYRQRRVGLGGAEFELLKLRTMVLGSDPVGIGTAVARDDPRVTARRPPPAPHLARRDPQPRQRPARRDGDRRAAADDPGAGRRLHAPPAPPPRGPPRDHRLGPGPGPGRDPLGGADRARRLSTSTTAAPSLDLRILARTAWLLVTGHGLAPD